MPPYKTPDISLREKEEEIEKHLREHTSISGAQITLANAVRKYLEIRKFAPSTYENYRYYFKKDIADSPLERTKAIDLVKSDIKAFYNKLSREGYEDGTIQIVHKITHPALEMLAMTDEVYRAFQKLREKSLKNPSKREVDGYSNFVFVNQRGGPMYPTNINKALYSIVDRYKEKTGKDFPTISNHIFRHTGCTVMAEAEVDPSTMKYIMGHKNVKMILKVYDSVNPERIRQQMKKLNKKPMEEEKQRAVI